MTVGSSVEFKLDFCAHLLKQDLPTYKNAVSSYMNTVQGAPLDIKFRPQRPGIFIITTNEKDAKKLENNHLTFYYGKKNEKQIKVKFEKMPKFQIYTDPKWITIDWVEDSGLRFAKNDFFDTFLKSYGSIIEPTKDDQNEMGMRNGRKKVRLDFDKGLHIKRVLWLETDIMLEDGTVKHVKGKVKFFYSNQPVFCRNCEVDHQGKCPEKVKTDALLKSYESKRKETSKTVLISDSLLRYTNEQALNSSSYVVSGAKIGHINNVLENYDVENIENVVLNVGLNNIDVNPNTNYDKWYNQQTPQFNQLHQNPSNLSQQGKNTRIVAVPKAPITDSTVKTAKMRVAINKFFETMAKTVNESYAGKVEVINVNENKENGIEVYEDDKHITKEQTEKVLSMVDESLKDLNFIIKCRPEAVPLTNKKIFSGVYSAYKLGCDVCTKPGHNKENCTVKESTKFKRKPSNEETNELKKVSLSK